MNENVAWLILPLVISGLGFLVYKHPLLSRIIILSLLLIEAIAYAFVDNISVAKINTYKDGINAIANTSIYRGTDSQAAITGINWDSILIDDPTLEEYNAVYGTPEQKNKHAKAMVVSRSIGMTKKKTTEAIRELIKKQEEQRSISENYFGFAAIGLIVFLILAYIFSNLPHAKEKKNKKADNEETPQENF